jgi:hypothetical protein
MSYDANLTKRLVAQTNSSVRSSHARMQGDWAGAAEEVRHQEVLDGLWAEEDRLRRNAWPSAWTLAAALFAGNAIKRALGPASGPVEPTQVVEAHVIREDATEAPRALPGPRSKVSLPTVLAIAFLIVFALVANHIISAL